VKIGVVGPGYIGSSIALKLHQSGSEIVSYSPSVKEFDWMHTTSINKARTVFENMDAIILAFGTVKIDTIDADKEFQFSRSLIEALVPNKLSSLFYVSSGAVYGECAFKMSEFHQCHPSTPYGNYKHMVERYLMDQFASRVTVLRISNPFSINSSRGILKTIRNSLVSRSAINFYGELDDCRDYLSLKDTSQIISELVLKAPQSSIYNVGSGISVSLREIEDLIRKNYSKKQLSINWFPRLPTNVGKTLLDVDRIKAECNLEYKDRKSILSELESLVVY
jgi:nucleoside-diphosphate-sugar epimerase